MCFSSVLSEIHSAFVHTSRVYEEYVGLQDGGAREGDDAICPVPRSSLHIRSRWVMGRYPCSTGYPIIDCGCRVIDAHSPSSMFTRLGMDALGVIFAIQDT